MGQNITNFFVEEGEVIQLMLSEYYSGSLLQYQLGFKVYDSQDGHIQKTRNGNIFEPNLDELSELIYLSSPFTVISYNQLEKRSYANDLQLPFPRSTLMIQDKIFNQIDTTIFLLTRNFIFQSYDASQYSQGLVTKNYELQLNRTLLNESCTDLLDIYYFGTHNLIMFCTSVTYDSKGVRQNFYTIVLVENFSSSVPEFRYLSFNQTILKLNSKIPLSFLGYESRLLAYGNYSVIFIGYGRTNDSNQEERPIIFRLYLDQFREMRINQETQRFIDQAPVEIKYYLTFSEDQFVGIKIGDLKMLYYTESLNINQWLAILMQGKGLLLCKIDINIFSAYDDERMQSMLYDCNSTNSQFVDYSDSISLYLNTKDTGSLYMATLQPPGVVQIDIRMPSNSYIKSIYRVQNEDSRYIGLPVIATNNKFILHLMQNMLTSQYVIRVYTKESSYFNVARFDLILPEYSRTNFFTFPHYWLNIIWFRDEQSINITTFDDNKLYFNAISDDQQEKSSWEIVKKYLYRPIEVSLKIKNDYNNLTSVFNVTFISQNDTRIYSKLSQSSQIENEIFYNCGDYDFFYIVNDYYNGPNYELIPLSTNRKKNTDLLQTEASEAIDSVQSSKASTQSEQLTPCQNGLCYFQFAKRKMQKQFLAEFDFKNCQHTVFDQELATSDEVYGKLVMVCIDKAQGKISAYTFCQISQVIWQTQEVEIVGAMVREYAYNPYSRVLMVWVISRSTEKIISNDLEVHFFSLQDTLIWMASSQADQLTQSNSVESVAYNSNSNYGIMIGNVSASNEQLITIFKVIPEIGVFETVLNIFQYRKDYSKVVKAYINKENFVYFLTKNNKIEVYEFIPGSFSSREICEFKLMWFMDFSFSVNLHINDFDIIEEKFLVLYMGHNNIQIWEIQMQIYWQYKMTLPLYDEYQSFKFWADGSTGQYIVKRSRYEKLLAVLLKSDDYRGKPSVRLFFYQFEGSQHDAFLMSQDLSDFYENSTFQNIYMISDGQMNLITIMSEKTLEMDFLRIYNFLKLTDDQRYLSELIQFCSGIKGSVNEQGILEEELSLIGSLQIQPITKFGSGENHNINRIDDVGENDSGILNFTEFRQQIETYLDNYALNEQVINLSIYTQNQGLITTPSQSNTSLFYTFNNDQNTEVKTQSIILETIIQGYNLSYEIQCTYHNEQGEVEDCTQVAIHDDTQTTVYQFFIEFVTSSTQVFTSFTLERLFFMFDTKSNLNVLRLIDDNLNLVEINGYPLETLKSVSQDNILGCEIHDYADYFKLFKQPGYTLYLMMYQCYLNDVLYLRMAQIKLFDKMTPEGNNCAIQVFKNYLKISNKILDIEVVNFQRHEGALPFVKGRISMTTEKEGSYSNILKVYDMNIMIVQNEIVFELKGIISAMIANKDTFKVGQMRAIPNSDLILVADQEQGAYIVDTQEMVILAQFNVNDFNRYKEQNFQQQGPLQVFSVAGNWPYSFHVLTNHGLFIFDFSTDLTDREAVLKDVKKALTPINVRIIKIYFDTYSYWLAANQFGYAFLVTKNTSQTNFDVYLGAVSFSALHNNKIIKMVKVTSNQQCMSLNEDSYLADGFLEDQIAVSFVCNTVAYVVRLCMKPHIVVDLQSFNQTASREIFPDLFEPGVLQYNQFNLTIQGKNIYTDTSNTTSGIVQLNFDFQTTYNSFSNNLSWFYFISLLLFMISALTIIFINQREDHEGHNNKHRHGQYSSQIRSSKGNNNSSGYQTAMNNKQSEYGRQLSGQMSIQSIGEGNLENRTSSARMNSVLGPNGLDLQQINKNKPPATPVLQNRKPTKIDLRRSMIDYRANLADSFECILEQNISNNNDFDDKEDIKNSDYKQSPEKKKAKSFYYRPQQKLREK